ncbi:MAG: DegT/DnrJ/EryC1/StrS aminotransferase family protein [Gemmatimonadota bacterium]
MTAFRIPLSDVTLGEEEALAVAQVVRSGWLTLGPEVRAFEEEFAEFVGVEGAVAVSNGTAALHLALHALGVQAGAEVIVPSLSFVATANSVVLAGGTPIFADVLSSTELTLDPGHVRSLITPRTVGVTAMHYGGRPARMAELQEICRAHNLFLLEDAAHGVGGYLGDEALGTVGDAGCFSFFGNKNMTTGEGGMVVAKDPGVLEGVRLARSHGMTAASWDRFAGHAWEYDVIAPGYNYRPTEITGAMGRIQLGRLPGNVARRRELLDVYARELGCDHRGVGEGLVLHPWGERGAAHLCVILLTDPGARDPLRTALADAGIQTSIHYPPSHLFRHYRESQGTGPGDLPVTEDVARRMVTLPLYPRLSDEQVGGIASEIRSFLGPS